MKRLLPAYPIFVKDPYFSLWSPSECLNESDVIFWTGDKKRVYGFLYIDLEPYSFMGDLPGVKKLVETDLKLTSYTTDYVFENEKLTLKLSFVSPLPLDNLLLLSCPVCYLKYEIIKKQPCDTKLVVAINANICYNEDKNDVDRKDVRGGIFDLDAFKCSWCGLKRQAPLSHASDSVQADWGYFYLSGESVGFLSKPYDFLPENKQEYYVFSENNASSGVLLLGYDDIVSINYFGDYLKGYYFDQGNSIIDALDFTFKNFELIDRELERWDKKIIDLSKKYGSEYLNLLYASLRQSIGAHKLVKDREGNILFLSKECHSNGCVGTVDVSYPSMPLYLLFNTELVKGMMRPIFKFAKMPVWTYDFAPHDVGTYPICGGQVYGLNVDRLCEKDLLIQTHADIYKFPANANAFKLDKQMPVEECANMIIMAYACYYYDGDSSFLTENFGLLSDWVVYLTKFGLKPENQLCTDDFAGHLSNNVNLAIKSTVAISCFARICEVLGKDFAKYDETAKAFAKEIEEFGKRFNHIPLTWDNDDQTFSLKYNFAFDKILGLNLFKQETFEREIDCYLQKANKYGTPLDSREKYTKSDWLLWSATLTNDLNKQRQIISCVNAFLTESPSRIPFGDWYVTDDAELKFFANRTVQGGIFILALLK